MTLLFDNCVVETGAARPVGRQVRDNAGGGGTAGGLPGKRSAGKALPSASLSFSLSLFSVPGRCGEAVSEAAAPGPQKGYCDTYIRSRITELPRKLMTVLTVIISKSSCMSRGPLMGRVITSVALMGPVCRI